MTQMKERERMRERERERERERSLFSLHPFYVPFTFDFVQMKGMYVKQAVQ